MLNRLRWKLTLLSTLLTGTVLVAALSFAYHLTRSQYLRACEMEFFGSVDTVQYQWNRFKILEDSFLYQMHTQQHIAFYLEETGMPLLHSLHVTEPTLIDAAKAAAQLQAGMDCAKAPIAGLSVMQADFPLHFSSTLYRCAARIDLQENGHWTLLLALQDTTPERIYCRQLALLFGGSGFLFLLTLFAACWFASGRAIRPVRNAMEQQQQFLSAAGHELRTPLAVIRANANAAHQQPAKTAHYLTVIESETGRMGNLVDELLLLSAGASARQRLKLTALEPDTFLLDFCESMEPLAEAKHRTLHTILPEGAVPSISADAYRLRQLLTILVENALRYASEGSCITLQLDTADKTVIFRVIDHGPGIPTPKKKQIFQRFVRLSQPEADNRHFGLGLAVAAELTELHGGKIWVEDTPGGGATFCVSITIRPNLC